MTDLSATATLKIFEYYFVQNNAKLAKQNFHYQEPSKTAKVKLICIWKCYLDVISLIIEYILLKWTK